MSRAAPSRTATPRRRAAAMASTAPPTRDGRARSGPRWRSSPSPRRRSAWGSRWATRARPRRRFCAPRRSKARLKARGTPASHMRARGAPRPPAPRRRRGGRAPRRRRRGLGRPRAARCGSPAPSPRRDGSRASLCSAPPPRAREPARPWWALGVGRGDDGAGVAGRRDGVAATRALALARSRSWRSRWGSRSCICSRSQSARVGVRRQLALFAAAVNASLASGRRDGWMPAADAITTSAVAARCPSRAGSARRGRAPVARHSRPS